MKIGLKTLPTAYCFHHKAANRRLQVRPTSFDLSEKETRFHPIERTATPSTGFFFDRKFFVYPMVPSEIPSCLLPGGMLRFWHDPFPRFFPVCNIDVLMFYKHGFFP